MNRILQAQEGKVPAARYGEPWSIVKVGRGVRVVDAFGRVVLDLAMATHVDLETVEHIVLSVNALTTMEEEALKLGWSYDVTRHHVMTLIRQVAEQQKQLAAMFDDAAVDRFACAMKEKMARARAKGRTGWADAGLSSAVLVDGLLGHLVKGNDGNYEDIANFCMMLHQRGDSPSELSKAVLERLGEQIAGGGKSADGGEA